MSPRNGCRSAVRLCRALALGALGFATLAGWPSLARAEGPSDYCQKVTARAEGDAALLFAPTLHAQLIRYPNSGAAADPSGLQLGQGVQPRAAVSLGLVDIYRGFGVLAVARTDCHRQESTVTLEEVLAQRVDVGRLPALQKKLAFFRERAATVEEMVRNAEERFAAHTTTLSDVQDIRRRALHFARNFAETESEIAILQGRHVPNPTQPLVELLAAYEQRTVEYEERVAHVRRLNPWKLNLTAGVTGSPSVDGFGVAELSYNVGGLFQHEGRAVQARASELKNARYEMRQQVEAMRRELLVRAERSRAEAVVIERELARMERDRAALEGTEAPNKHTVLATMTLEMLELEAEHTYLLAIAERHATVGGAK